MGHGRCGRLVEGWLRFRVSRRTEATAKPLAQRARSWLSSGKRFQVGLFDGGGEEGLLGWGGGEVVESELAGGLGAEFEEESGAAGGVGVYRVDGTEPGGAVEVGCVGDGEEG